MMTEMMDARSDAVFDPSVYESLDFDSESHEGHDIATTLYDGK